MREELKGRGVREELWEGGGVRRCGGGVEEEEEKRRGGEVDAGRFSWVKG